MDIFLKLMLALIFSATLSFFLLRGLRDEMAEEMAEAAERRRAEKERLRSALAGEDERRTDVRAPATADSERPPADPASSSGPRPAPSPAHQSVGRHQLVEPGTFGHGLFAGLIRYAMPPEPPETPPVALVRLVRSQICSNCSRL